MQNTLSYRKRAEWPWVTLVLGVATLGCHVLPDGAEWLRYDHDLPAQVWRVFTCHGVHWDKEHLVWSLGTFVALGIVCEPGHRRAFRGCVGLAALAIPAVLWFAQSDLRLYGGLSGIDAALFGFLAVALLRKKARQRAWGWVAGGVGLLTAFGAKIVYEFLTGDTVFVGEASALLPVPLAHAVGGAVGIAVACLEGADTRAAVKLTATSRAFQA